MHREYSHAPHVALGQQRNLQDFGVRLHDLVARGGHGLSGYPVNLVEGVRPQKTIICRPDKQLQGQRLTLHVAVKLKDI